MTDQPLPRIKAGDFTPATQSVFQTHFEARTTEALADCFHPLYLNPVNNRLRPGDRVTLCQFTDGSWNEMVAFVSLRIIRIDGGQVYFTAEAPIVKCDPDVVHLSVSEPIPVMVKKIAGAYEIIGLDDFNIAPVQFPTRKECVDWIERNSNSVYLDSGKTAAA